VCTYPYLHIYISTHTHTVNIYIYIHIYSTGETRNIILFSQKPSSIIRMELHFLIYFALNIVFLTFISNVTVCFRKCIAPCSVTNVLWHLFMNIYLLIHNIILFDRSPSPLWVMPRIMFAVFIYWNRSKTGDSQLAKSYHKLSIYGHKWNRCSRFSVIPLHRSHQGLFLILYLCRRLFVGSILCIILYWNILNCASIVEKYGNLKIVCHSTGSMCSAILSSHFDFALISYAKFLIILLYVNLQAFLLNHTSATNSPCCGLSFCGRYVRIIFYNV